MGLEARVAESTPSSEEVSTNRADGNFRSALDKRRVFQSVCLNLPNGTDKLDEFGEVFKLWWQRYFCEREFLVQYSCLHAVVSRACSFPDEFEQVNGF